MVEGEFVIADQTGAHNIDLGCTRVSIPWNYWKIVVWGIVSQEITVFSVHPMQSCGIMVLVKIQGMIPQMSLFSGSSSDNAFGQHPVLQ
jgi:hypothetical protein